MRNSITESPVKLNTYQVMGRRLMINFNEETVVRTNEDGTTETSYKYKTARVDKLAGRNDMVEEIMKTHYPTFGSELAAIHNGGTKLQEHEDLRVLAKSLADGWLQENGS